MGKTGHTGRLLGIWKPKLVKPRSKTKLYKRAVAGRITFQRSSHEDNPLLGQNRERIDFRQHLSCCVSGGDHRCFLQL